MFAAVPWPLAGHHPAYPLCRGLWQQSRGMRLPGAAQRTAYFHSLSSLKIAKMKLFIKMPLKDPVCRMPMGLALIASLIEDRGLLLSCLYGLKHPKCPHVAKSRRRLISLDGNHTKATECNTMQEVLPFRSHSWQ